MKTRKQWIAMILMLAMLFTALPMTAFAEQKVPAEPDTEMQEPETQIENDTESLPEELEESETKPMQPLGEPQQETIKVPLYLHYPETTAEGRSLPYGDWLSEGKQNFSADTVTKAEAFWKNLKQHCKFYVRKDGKITPWEPTIWQEIASGSYFYYVDVPKDVEYVFLEVDGQELPAEFSMGDYSVRNKHWYYCEPSDNRPDFDIYVYQVNLVFDPNGGQYPGGSVTPYTTTINNKNQIKYPDAPTREGYLFKDWVVPIYATKDLTLGGGTATSQDISPDKGAETSEHVAILEHGKTNGNFGWTFNHFWWIYERDKPKLNNTRTFYARWERPTLTFYKDPDTTKTDVLKSMKAYNGKSLQDTDWNENKDLEKITELPKATAPEGMEFKGWVYYDANNGRHDFDMTTTVDGNMNLYPVFEKSTTPDPGTDQPDKPINPDKPVTPDKPGTDQPGTEKPDTPQTPEKPNKPSVPSVDSKIKTPRGSALTAEEIAKILAGSKKVIPSIPRAGVGR